jgi:hypothetical protein
MLRTPAFFWLIYPLQAALLLSDAVKDTPYPEEYAVASMASSRQRQMGGAHESGMEMRLRRALDTCEVDGLWSLCPSLPFSGCSAQCSALYDRVFAMGPSCTSFTRAGAPSSRTDVADRLSVVQVLPRPFPSIYAAAAGLCATFTIRCAYG